MSRLFELAALGVALITAGAVLAAPSILADQRLAVLAAIVGGFLLVARVGRRRSD